MPAAPGDDYRVASAEGTTVAGFIRTPEHAKAMPDMWVVYFGVL